MDTHPESDKLYLHVLDNGLDESDDEVQIITEIRPCTVYHEGKDCREGNYFHQNIFDKFWALRNVKDLGNEQCASAAALTSSYNFDPVEHCASAATLTNSGSLGSVEQWASAAVLTNTDGLDPVQNVKSLRIRAACGRRQASTNSKKRGLKRRNFLKTPNCRKKKSNLPILLKEHEGSKSSCSAFETFPGVLRPSTIIQRVACKKTEACSSVVKDPKPIQELKGPEQGVDSEKRAIDRRGLPNVKTAKRCKGKEKICLPTNPHVGNGSPPRSLFDTFSGFLSKPAETWNNSGDNVKLKINHSAVAQDSTMLKRQAESENVAENSFNPTHKIDGASRNSPVCQQPVGKRTGKQNLVRRIKTSELFKRKQVLCRALTPFFSDRHALSLHNSVKMLQRLVKNSTKHCGFLNDYVSKKDMTAVNTKGKLTNEELDPRCSKIKLGSSLSTLTRKEQPVNSNRNVAVAWSPLKILLLKRRRALSRKEARRTFGLKQTFMTVLKTTAKTQLVCHMNRKCRTTDEVNVQNEERTSIIRNGMQSSTRPLQSELFTGRIRDNKSASISGQRRRAVRKTKYANKPAGLAHKLAVMILLRRRNFAFRMQLAKSLAKLRRHCIISKDTADASHAQNVQITQQVIKACSPKLLLHKPNVKNSGICDALCKSSSDKSQCVQLHHKDQPSLISADKDGAAMNILPTTSDLGKTAELKNNGVRISVRKRLLLKECCCCSPLRKDSKISNSCAKRALTTSQKHIQKRKLSGKKLSVSNVSDVVQNNGSATSYSQTIVPQEQQPVKGKSSILAVRNYSKSVTSSLDNCKPYGEHNRQAVAQKGNNCSKRVHFGRTNVILISPRSSRLFKHCQRTNVPSKRLFKRNDKLVKLKTSSLKAKLKKRHKLHVMLLLKRRNFAFRRKLIKELNGQCKLSSYLNHRTPFCLNDDSLCSSEMSSISDVNEKNKKAICVSEIAPVCSNEESVDCAFTEDQETYFPFDKSVDVYGKQWDTEILPSINTTVAKFRPGQISMSKRSLVRDKLRFWTSSGDVHRRWSSRSRRQRRLQKFKLHCSKQKSPFLRRPCIPQASEIVDTRIAQTESVCVSAVETLKKDVKQKMGAQTEAEKFSTQKVLSLERSNAQQNQVEIKRNRVIDSKIKSIRKAKSTHHLTNIEAHKLQILVTMKRRSFLFRKLAERKLVRRNRHFLKLRNKPTPEVLNQITEFEPQQPVFLPPVPSQQGSFTIRIVPGIANTVANYRKKHPFRCQFCFPPFTTEDRNELQVHIRNNHPERCQRCRKTFPSKMERILHPQECHKIHEEHHCNMCQKMFFGVNQFRRHVASKTHKTQVSVHKKALRHIIEAVTGQSVEVSSGEPVQNNQVPRTRYYYDDSEILELFHSALEYNEKPDAPHQTDLPQRDCSENQFWAPISPPETEVSQEAFVVTASPMAIGSPMCESTSELDCQSGNTYDSVIVDFLHSRPSCTGTIPQEARFEQTPSQNYTQLLPVQHRNTVEALQSPYPESVKSSETAYTSKSALLEKYPNLVFDSDLSDDIYRPSLFNPELSHVYDAQYETLESGSLLSRKALESETPDHFMEALNEWWMESGF